MSPSKPEFIGPKGRDGNPINLKIPAFASAAMMLVLVTVVALGMIYNTCFVYVQPNEFGIKEVKIGTNRGIQERVYGAGLALSLPVINTIHKFPRDVQVFELTREKYSPVSGVHVGNMANIQTSDGFFVDVDVTILYHIVDPYAVITKLGPGRLYLEQGIIPKAEPILKETLGQLTTEEFYNSPMRVEKQELARQMLDNELQDKGMTIERVLIRYFEYSPAIQQNIEDKKLQDQLVFTNLSKRKAAEQEQQLMRVREEGEYNVKIALQEGDAYRVEREAERDLYVRSKEAEADLLIKLAEAESTRMKNDALQTVGADSLVALEMAKVLSGLESIIVPAGIDGLNPLDLDGILTLFGVSHSPGASVPGLQPEHTPSPLLQELIKDSENALEMLGQEVPEAPVTLEEVQ